MSFIQKAAICLVGSLSTVSATSDRANTEVRARSEISSSSISGHFDLVQPTYTSNTQISGEVRGLYKAHRHEVQIVEDSEEKNKVFNPFGKQDAGPWSADRKVGNIGSFVTDEQGTGKYEISDPFVKLSGPFSVVGKSLAVFENTFNCVEGKVKSEKVFKGRGNLLGTGVIRSN